jgi:hypothetical protein
MLGVITLGIAMPECTNDDCHDGIKHKATQPNKALYHDDILHNVEECIKSYTPSIMAVIISALSITTLSIMTLGITRYTNGLNCHSKLNLSFFQLNVVMVIVVMLNVLLLVIMLSVVMMGVITLVKVMPECTNDDCHDGIKHKATHPSEGQ